MMIKGLRANSVKQVMTARCPGMMTCSPQRLSLLLTPALAFLVSATALSFEATPSAAQENHQVQTAARSKPASAPAAQWAGRNADGSASPQPKVTYEDGLLTINANNSSLADILFAVHACTGADIDLPNNASTERVTAQLGPGPARKVLSDLLGWSNFDYIIQGSATDALAIHSVTLMVRIKGGTSTPVAEPLRKGSTIPARQAPEEVTPPVTPDIPEAQTVPDQQPASAPDSMAPSVDPRARPVPVAPTGVSNAGKSTSEMIQELQQMYEQRRSMQAPQGQTSGPKSP
jgi:hypothetical protein